MKEKFKYLLFSIALLFGMILNVNALNLSDIELITDNGKKIVSFSKEYNSRKLAESDVLDFKNYVLKNNGVLNNSVIDTIVTKINTQIEKNTTSEFNSKEEVLVQINKLQKDYDKKAMSSKSYEVTLESIDTIKRINKLIEKNSGLIGEYNTLQEASNASLDAKANNNENYIVETSINKDKVLDHTDTILLNEAFNTQLGAQLFLLNYKRQGYNIDNTSITPIIVSNITKETKEFNKLTDIELYKKVLELQGYEVQAKLLGLNINIVKSDVTDIDQEFNKLTDVNKYIVSLGRQYNNLTDLKIKDESYNDITDTDVTSVFNTEKEANDYLNSLKSEYRVTNDSITKNNEQTRNEEKITKYFTNESDAQNYLNNLYSPDYTLENTSINKLNVAEIDINKILSDDTINLNKEDKTYSSLTSRLTTKVNVNGKSENGTVIISSIKVNGNSYSLLKPTQVNNNSVVEITGKVRYCSTRGRFNICIKEDTKEFTSYGVLNSDYNSSSLDSTFTYNIDNINITDDGVIVNDNLVSIYKLDTTKVTINTNPTYIVNAHIYKANRVFKFRVVGTVSNVSLVPVYKVEYTKIKNTTTYNVIGMATKDIYKDIFRVNYDLTKISEITDISYIGNYTVTQTDSITTYCAKATGTLYTTGNKSDEIQAPKTGIVDTNSNKYILILLPIIILGLAIIKSIKSNN